MFTEPHLSRGQMPRWWSPPLSTLGPLLPVVVLMALSWMWWVRSAEETKNVLPTWRFDLAQAEFWREKGEPYRAMFFYGQAFRVASLSDDWEGLLAIACGLRKLGRVWGEGMTAHMVLIRALAAAQRKQNPAGLGAVANAFTILGEPAPASSILSHAPQAWPRDETESEDPVTQGCWNSERKGCDGSLGKAAPEDFMISKIRPKLKRGNASPHGTTTTCNDRLLKELER